MTKRREFPSKPRTRNILAPAIRQALAEDQWTADGLQPRSSLEPTVRIWSDVLTPTSLDALQVFVTSLEGSYWGGSYWCPASEEIQDWSSFFSVFASLVGPTSAAGVEWWIRRARPAESKDFHFDKDERLFQEQARLMTPAHATVFYLSGAGGPTLIAAQTAKSNGEPIPAVPTELAAINCVVNRLLQFPGNLSHAVLGRDVEGLRVTLLMNWWDRKPTGVEWAPATISFPSIRLGKPSRVAPRIFVQEIFTALV